MRVYLLGVINFGWAKRTALIATGALDVGTRPLVNYVRGPSPPLWASVEASPLGAVVC